MGHGPSLTLKFQQDLLPAACYKKQILLKLKREGEQGPWPNPAYACQTRFTDSKYHRNAVLARVDELIALPIS